MGLVAVGHSVAAVIDCAITKRCIKTIPIELVDKTITKTIETIVLILIVALIQIIATITN